MAYKNIESYKFHNHYNIFMIITMIDCHTAT